MIANTIVIEKRQPWKMVVGEETTFGDMEGEDEEDKEKRREG